MNLSDFVELSIFPARRLSARHKQLLDRILLGDGEKQTARHLRVAQNTLHVYVKYLYIAYGVQSRS